MKICKCGCGGTKEPDSKGRLHGKYLRGHNPLSRNGFPKGHNAYRKTKFVNKTCPTCKNQFSLKAVLKRQRYCSRECRTQDQQIEKKCTYCEKIMILPKSWGWRKTCGYACKNAIQRKKDTRIELKLKQFLIKEDIGFKEQYKVGDRFLFDFYLSFYFLTLLLSFLLYLLFLPNDKLCYTAVLN